MRKIQIIGNLGKDAEIKVTEKSNFITFSVATSRYAQDKVLWITCNKNRSTELAQYLKKGTKVFVSGNLSIREYTSNGVTKFEPICQVDEIEFVGGSRQEQTQQNVNVPFENQQRAQRVNDDLFGGQVSTNNDSWI